MTAFAVIAAAILFYMALSYLPALGNALKKLSRILSPFIWGLVFTYLLTPLMRSMEKHLFYPLGKKLYRKNPVGAKRFGRVLSVLLSIIVLLAVLTALVYMILPQIYSSIETIITNSPVYLENLNNWFDKVLTDFPALPDFVDTQLGEVNDNFTSWLTDKVLPQVGSFVTNLTSGV